MSEEYSNHREQLEAVMGLESRMEFLQEALMDAFHDYIFMQEVPFVNFGEMTADELASAFIEHPIIIKSVLTCVNVATRAIKRDLDIDINTYNEKIDPTRAGIIAGYIRPILPNTLSIPALCELDRYSYVDKELRKKKGSWEKTVLHYLNENATVEFMKRKFKWNDDEFEIDAASPPTGDDIKIAIDVKRIESKRDIHKRADEIVNKAKKFKEVFPNGHFFAVIYYPFTSDHLSLTKRLEDESITGIYFASENESSIEQQTKFVLGKAKVLKPQDEVSVESDSI